MPVQRVVRPDQSFRGYAGQVASGVIRPGDAVTVLPSGLRSRVARIATFDGDLEEAYAPMAATLVLEDELDISRGDLLYSGAASPAATNRFEAQVVWMDSRALDPKRRYLLKHTTRTVSVEVAAIHHQVNIHTLAEESAGTLEMNAIGRVEFRAAKPIFFDIYSRNRATGSFILIDPETNLTSGAGMILQAVAETARASRGQVTAEERVARWGHRGAVVRLGERKTLAQTLERKLFERGCAVVVLDGSQEEIGKALEQTGVLALVMGGSPAEPLPDNDLDAAGAVIQRMQVQGILPGQVLFTEGEGI
jgi:selenocysteine-specific translation elongation factor